MQSGFSAQDVVLPLHVLEQGRGHQVLETGALVAFDQAGVVKIHLGRLQH